MDAASATTRVSRLRTLNLKELQEAYEKELGKATKSRNRDWLFKTVARKIQGDDEPESSKRPVPLAQLVAKYSKKGRSKNATKSAKREKSIEPKKSKTRVKPVGDRDPRLPKAGTTIEREYKGKKLHITVESDGFTFGGKSYKSLSALAQYITGSAAINGFLFFQLGDYAKKEKAGK